MYLSVKQVPTIFSELLIQKQSDKDFNMEKQYYPCVVIHALMNILQDKSLNEYHSQVVQIIITVFQVFGGDRGRGLLYFEFTQTIL